MAELAENLDRGGKALGVDELYARAEQLGYHVPEYDVVSPDHFALFETESLAADIRDQVAGVSPEEFFQTVAVPSVIAEEIKTLAEKYRGQKVKVRSNSRLEGKEHSFRGRHESVTVECVDEASLQAAMLEVYASLYGPKAVHYRADNGIESDDMGIIVQTYAEGDFYGKLQSSKDGSPSTMTMSFSATPEAVTDGLAAEVFTVDRTKLPDRTDLLYASDNFENQNPTWISDLGDIAVALENEFGPVELEFSVKDGVINLFQKDDLRGLAPDEPVDIPEYPAEAFLGSTRMNYGNGAVRLPVVKIPNLDDIMVQHALKDDPEFLRSQSLMAWVMDIQRLDAQYSDGYVLVTPHFNESLFGQYAKVAQQLKMDGVRNDDDFNTLTPNKRMVVTTNVASPHAHIMDIARDSGLAYAGFLDQEEAFADVHNGDEITAYFKDGQAFLYKEAPEALASAELVKLPLAVENEPTYYSFQLDEDGANTVASIGQALAINLNSLGDETWTWETGSGFVGGSLFSAGGEKVSVRGMRNVDTYTCLSIAKADIPEKHKLLFELLASSFTE